jgi:hypothetical protein
MVHIRAAVVADGLPADRCESLTSRKPIWKIEGDGSWDDLMVTDVSEGMGLCEPPGTSGRWAISDQPRHTVLGSALSRLLLVFWRVSRQIMRVILVHVRIAWVVWVLRSPMSHELAISGGIPR